MKKLEYYIRLFKNDLRIRNNRLDIRLAGDGTQIGNNLSVLNFKDYNDTKISLKETLDELKVMKTIEVDGTEYSLEFYLGGDLKFIAIVLGKIFSRYHFFRTLKIKPKKFILF